MSNQPANTPKQKPTSEPSLGPACLVVAILALAIFTAFCAFGSWFMFSDQYPLALRGIERQLIPWVEQSSLADADKRSIVQQLRDLMPRIRDREITTQQLSRLHSCLQDNPVLLWGTVQAIQRVAHDQTATDSTADATTTSNELTSLEIETLDRVVDRLLRAAAERKLSRNDMEYALDSCARQAENGGGLIVKQQLTPPQIRQFMQRAEQRVQEQEIPNERYEKTPSQAFRLLIESALKVE